MRGTPMKLAKWLHALIALLLSAALSSAFASDACNEAFDKLDADKNNVLTYDEFSKFEHLKKIPFADMKEFDRNNDGKVSFEEACQAMFDKADKNHNGKIDRKEWEEFYNSIMPQ